MTTSKTKLCMKSAEKNNSSQDSRTLRWVDTTSTNSRTVSRKTIEKENKEMTKKASLLKKKFL